MTLTINLSIFKTADRIGLIFYHNSHNYYLFSIFIVVSTKNYRKKDLYENLLQLDLT